MSAKKKSPLKQLTLNFGQRAQKAIKCAECDLVYNPNIKEDVQLHLKYHSDFDSTLRYTFSSKNEKIIESFADGSRIVVIESGVRESKQALKKAMSILEYVDSQLGINEESTIQVPEATKFYLYICGLTKKVSGFCMAEPLQYAFRIIVLNNKKSTSSFSYDENLPGEATRCGISRIWVAMNMRRKGIAKKLLDCVRLNFLFFESLGLDDIAFSDPTHFGQALARNYCKTESFLVYNSRKNQN